jgi:CheY-like chemotaxis protein
VVRLARSGRDAIVEVADTGIGIDPAHVNGLFEPFMQADPGIASRFGGSGLGLALARALARDMGGDIDIVTTAPDEGTTVRLRLPEWQLVDTSQSPGEPASPPPALSELDGICVLLADDHDDVRTSLARLLTLCGATVCEARSGAEAIEIGSRPDVDLVLMDRRMPDINGLEATRRLRAMGVATPIVALTADVVDDRRHDAAGAGFTTNLAKPVDADRLVAMIRSLVRDRAQTRSTLAPR